ncbi:MAG: hypothetical protein JWM53_60 [bacterium]|nr:hypothetical protein [bacterium]
MTERLEMHNLGACFAVHRALWEAAAALSRRLSTSTEDGYLLHLGASCMRIASESALQARNENEGLRAWRECILADRQIKLATYLALRRGTIDNGTFDDIFAMAREASRLREEERQRLRRQLNRQIIV